MPGLLAIGCSARICRAKWTLKRQKSISSQAASISAWNAVFDWPSMVAALIRWRHGPASRSAALRMIAARSSNESACHPGAASFAALTAASASRVVEFFMTPRTCWWSCGWTTLISAPPPLRRRPPMCARRLDLPAFLPLELRSSCVALRTARRVRQVRLVDGVRRVGDGVHARDAVRQAGRAQFLLRRANGASRPCRRSGISWVAYQPRSSSGCAPSSGRSLGIGVYGDHVERG